MRTLTCFVVFFISNCVFSQFQVGHTTITFNDPSRSGGFGSGGGSGRQIQTEIYYPAVSAGENTPVANDTFPVIVFGHGFVMSWDAYQNIWNHYTPLGYILAFPRTEGSLIPAPSHNDFGLDLKLIEQRMQIENSSATSLFFQKVKPASAIMGHSMGGGATILAGAGNTNIRTIVGLAPAETNPSAIAAAPNVEVPTIVFSGSQDGVTPPADHHIPIYQGVAAPCKTFVSIIGGAHCYFANTNFNCDFGEATSSTGISISRADQQTRTYSLLDLWLDYHLKDNCAAYDLFMGISDDSPTTLAVQSTCSSSSTPVISFAGNNLISSVNGQTYEWTYNGASIPSSNSIQQVILGNGTYTVTVTAANGCIETSAPFNVTNASLAEQSGLQKIAVYPNPVTEILNISMLQTDFTQCKVFTASGRCVMEFEYQKKCDVSGLQSGVYFLCAGEKVVRFVKE
jgi:dienelactone hydrolase